MTKYFILTVLFLTLLLGCAKKQSSDFTCPDISELRQDKKTGIFYSDFIDCEPPTYCRDIGYDIDEYEEWVNENCNIKFKIPKVH
ncbi:hypothetical protein KAI92_00205 [Candidatus Parcubacteria bacterium]|nr:hypothetical protein [Candidatus Parcubacteria bacterium]